MSDLDIADRVEALGHRRVSSDGLVPGCCMRRFSRDRSTSPLVCFVRNPHKAPGVLYVETKVSM